MFEWIYLRELIKMKMVKFFNEIKQKTIKRAIQMMKFDLGDSSFITPRLRVFSRIFSPSSKRTTDVFENFTLLSDLPDLFDFKLDFL